MVTAGNGVGRPEDPRRAGFREFRREAIEQSIQARFQQQVAERPEALAVVTRERSLTYDALNRTTNRLAAAILDHLGSREEPVALLLDQGVDAVIAILAVLKAGKFFLPLDPRHPQARLTGVLDDAGARLLVTEAKHAAFASRLANGQRAVLLVGDGAGGGNDVDTDAPQGNDGNRFLPPSPEQLAYLFYTSGSTGRPKGVVDSHRNVLHNVMRYTNALRITPLGSPDARSVANVQRHGFESLLGPPERRCDLSVRPSRRGVRVSRRLARRDADHDLPLGAGALPQLAKDRAALSIGTRRAARGGPGAAKRRRTIPPSL